MRTCAHVSISDCKTANKVQYCYCDTQACNSPDSHLAPAVSSRTSHEQRDRAGKRHEGEKGVGRGGKHDHGKHGKHDHVRGKSGVERKALGFTSAAHSPPAFASQYPGGHFSDDEVIFHS